MPMNRQRSKPLHNFTLPCSLRWGNQRSLRCIKVDSDDQTSPHHRFTAAAAAAATDRHHRRTTRARDLSSELLNGSHKLGGGSTPPQQSDENENDGDGIAAIREKVMFDLQTAADKMKDAIFKDGLEKGGGEFPAETIEGESNRPWNLRTRRAACKTELKIPGGSGGGAAGGNGGGDGKGLKVDVPRPNSGYSPMRVAAAAVVEKSPVQRNGGGGGESASGEKKERAKFSVALSKREIEEDFVGVFGLRLPRRPKKRPKMVQRQLDTLFPGLWLTEVNLDMYKVPEAAP